MGEAEVRQWLQQLVTGLPVQHIQSRGQPYLDRYFLAGWRPGVQTRIPALYLHHFLSSDPSDEVHSHPWEATSIILLGAYREHRCLGDQSTSRDFWPGEMNHIHPQDRHRVELLTPDVWTLLVRGPLVQDWAFFPDCGETKRCAICGAPALPGHLNGQPVCGGSECHRLAVGRA